MTTTNRADIDDESNDDRYVVKIGLKLTDSRSDRKSDGVRKVPLDRYYARRSLFAHSREIRQNVNEIHLNYWEVEVVALQDSQFSVILTTNATFSSVVQPTTRTVLLRVKSSLAAITRQVSWLNRVSILNYRAHARIKVPFHDARRSISASEDIMWSKTTAQWFVIFSHVMSSIAEIECQVSTWKGTFIRTLLSDERHYEYL